MRKAAAYPAPGYVDPNDLRLVRMIKPSASAEPGSVNILGVPFDGAVLGRKGAARGPEAIRRSLSGFSNFNYELDIGLEGTNIVDLGDVSIGSNEIGEAHSLINAEVAGAVRDGSLLAILGGDNSISLPALAACARKFGTLGLVVVDSHLDLRGRIGGKPTSGSSYGLAIESGFVSSDNVVEIGVHGFLNSRQYVQAAEKMGIKVVSAEEVASEGPKSIGREAYRAASRGVGAVYLSVDLDAVDLSSVLGVSAPSSGGITARELCVLSFEIARGEKVKCADLVEVAPALDPAGGAQRVAATVLTYLMGGFAARRAPRTGARSPSKPPRSGRFR